MYSFLNITGMLLSLVAVWITGKTLFHWKGPLWGGLVLFFAGFVLLGFSFLLNFILGAGGSSQLELMFFALGIALLTWGAERMLTYTHGGENEV